MLDNTVLFLVPTPIGNLADMTFRAIDVLKSVDLILAEDTRTSGVLLKHYEIHTPMKSFHAHNEHQQTEVVIKKLEDVSKSLLFLTLEVPVFPIPAIYWPKRHLMLNFK
jgi:16S rRNA (cytidine1402-2'-O)-methyltransferase